MRYLHFATGPSYSRREENPHADFLNRCLPANRMDSICFSVSPMTRNRSGSTTLNTRSTVLSLSRSPTFSSALVSPSRSMVPGSAARPKKWQPLLESSRTLICDRMRTRGIPFLEPLKRH